MLKKDLNLKSLVKEQKNKSYPKPNKNIIIYMPKTDTFILHG